MPLFYVREKEEPLDEMLKRNPNAIFICDDYAAVYSPGLKRTILRLGNYMSCNVDELNFLLHDTNKCILI